MDEAEPSKSDTKDLDDAAWENLALAASERLIEWLIADTKALDDPTVKAAKREAHAARIEAIERAFW